MSIKIIRNGSDTFNPLTGSSQHQEAQNSWDAFATCRSNSALGCLAEGFAEGFLMGFFLPATLLSGCGTGRQYGEAFAANEGGASDAQSLDGNTRQPQDTGLDAIADSATDTDATTDDADAMSVPDEGITLVDSEQDGATDTGLDAIADSATDTDVMSVPDDGITLVDSEQDGAADAGLDAIADSATDTDATTDDADAMSTPDDGMTPIDVKEDSASEVDACNGKPTCTAGPGSVVKKDINGKEYIEVTINQNEGQTSANVTFLMSGTNYDCENPALPAKELPGDATPVTIKYAESQTAVFEKTCSVYLCNDASMSNECPPVKITVIPKDTISFSSTMSPKGTGISTDTTVVFEAASSKGEALNCGVTFQKDGKDILTIPATLQKNNSYEAMADNKIPPMSDICFQPTCASQSGVSAKGESQCFTTTDKDLVLWVRDKDQSGKIAKDSSGKGNDGILQGNTTWNNSVLSCDGKTAAATIKNSPTLDTSNGFTLSALLQGSLPTVNGRQQTVVSRWSSSISNLTQPEKWKLFDAKTQLNANAAGFIGVASDGLCDYYSPGALGTILRYCENKGGIEDKKAWDSVDLSAIGFAKQALTFSGAFFADPNICFVPSQKNKAPSGQLVCFNKNGDLNNSTSWKSADLTQLLTPKAAGFEGAISTGDSVILASYSNNMIARYNSKTDLTSADSWSYVEPTINGSSDKPLGFEGGVFSYPYVYFVPYVGNSVVRYNTTLNLNDPKAIESFDLLNTGVTKTKVQFAGATNDGSRIIFTPLNDGAKPSSVFVIYDVTKDFQNATSWTSVNLTDFGFTDTIKGNFGAVNTGGFSVFSPNHAGTTNNSVLAIDSMTPPLEKGAWSLFSPYQNQIGDGTKYTGLIYVNGVVRFSPYYGQTNFSGQILQLDTTDNNCAYQLNYSQTGNDGGFSGGPYGISCMIKTDQGVFSVSSNKITTANNQHQITCTYNNTSLKLFLDGSLVNSTNAGGKILNSTLPLSLGGLENGASAFVGGIKEVRIWATAKTDDQIKNL